jgi:predicted nucleotidyltransferase
MKTLRDTRERKEKRRKALEQNLPSIVKQLKALGALKVILFGSFARGDTGSWSDLDLIAVMPSSLSGKEWRRKIYGEVDRGIACDIAVYNEKELEETIPSSSFLRHALKEGRTIYEKKP